MHNLKMDKNTELDIIWEFQKKLIAIYKTEKLKCIAGFKGNFIIEGENVLASFMAAVRKGQEIYKPEIKGEKPKFDYNRARADLKLISDEILHFTGLTCLYSRYLTNPLDRPVPTQNGEIVYANIQNLPDKRFYMYATCAYEKLYNYWDRIGDLLASYFPEIIKPEKVYFSKIDKFIPIDYQDESSIKWLIEFKNNKFQALNDIRIGVVHYENLATTFSSEHLENFKNKTQLELLVQNRAQIIPDLRLQIDLTLKGFVNVIRFMEFLNTNVLNNEKIKKKRKKQCITEGYSRCRKSRLSRK